MRTLPLFMTTHRAVLVVTALLFASCAVTFVGPYDEVTDKAVTDLGIKTEQFFAKMQASGGTYEANKGFYLEMKASIRAIRLRAELYGETKNRGELSSLDGLAANFDNLAELHRAGPLTGKAGDISHTLIEANLKALMQIELAKKRSSGISAGKTN